MIQGIGPDAPTVVNLHGGKQSVLPFRCDLLPPHAIINVCEVLEQGAKKYGKDNWRNIPLTDHLNHAMAHIFAHFAGDQQDIHIAHAACRLLFALEATDDLPDPFLPTSA